MRMQIYVLICAFFCLLSFAASAQQDAVKKQPQHQPVSEYFKNLGTDYKSLGESIMASIHNNMDDKVAEALDDCESNDNGDTIGMEECLSQAYKTYDIILNKIYVMALEKNDEKTQIALKSSQRKWLSFRQDEAKAQAAYSNAEWRGTVMGVALEAQNLSAIRERISEIMMYLGSDQG